jgi:hypothetical protein
MATEGVNPDGSHRTRLDQLPRQAQLAAWTTPQAHDAHGRSATQKELHGTKHGCACLTLDAQLTGWPSPTAMDTIPRTGLRPSRIATNRDSGYLSEIAQMAGWQSPTAGDCKGRDYQYDQHDKTKPRWSNEGVSKKIVGPARLTASGELLIGCCAGTRGGGQLSPAHSLWLMLGHFAIAWLSCAERVTRSRSGKRKGS